MMAALIGIGPSLLFAAAICLGSFDTLLRLREWS